MLNVNRKGYYQKQHCLLFWIRSILSFNIYRNKIIYSFIYLRPLRPSCHTYYASFQSRSPYFVSPPKLRNLFWCHPHNVNLVYPATFGFLGILVVLFVLQYFVFYTRGPPILTYFVWSRSRKLAYYIYPSVLSRVFSSILGCLIAYNKVPREGGIMESSEKKKGCSKWWK